VLYYTFEDILPSPYPLPPVERVIPLPHLPLPLPPGERINSRESKPKVDMSHINIWYLNIQFLLLSFLL